MLGSVTRKVRNWLAAARALREFLRDCARYLKFSTPTGDMNLSTLGATNRECQMTKEYHRIEKGLALRRPRQPFGNEPERRLRILLNVAQSSTPFESDAATALAALSTWNRDGQKSDTVAPLGPEWSPGVPEREAYDLLFSSRRSVRTFSEKVPPSAEIDAAVALAINTPSVCNRQPWRAHLFSGQQAANVLEHHNGSGAFASEVPLVLVVTSRTGLFAGTGERNQRWIDGGLFAMSLVWALHSRGIATCFLNWSRDNASTSDLRKTANIATDEDVVVLIGLGYPEPGYRVARSRRRTLGDVLVRH